ncbi:hypothetical protein PybrP1_012180 [[Pythium] brassicae (nom. inval.)]|nr:hypothetical protein PybrP1_012180 [[Pythium] brassicae (nom. inval.)]
MVLSMLMSRKHVASSAIELPSRPALGAHVVPGYEAPLLWPVFLATLLGALLLNEYHQHVFHKQQHDVAAPAVPHALVVAVAAALLAVHEAARPCADSLADVGALLCGAITDAASAATQHARRGFRPQFRGWSGAFHVVQAVLNTIARTHGRNVIWLRNAQVLRRNSHAFGRVQGWLSCFAHGTTTERFAHIGLEHLWLRSKDTARISRRSFAVERDASRKLSAPTRSRRSSGESETDTDSDADPHVSDTRRQPEPTLEPLVLLYFHGGGYSSMSPDVYVDFCNRLRLQLEHEFRTVGASQEKEERGDAPCPQGAASATPEVHVLIANYRKIPEAVYPAPADDCMSMYEHLTRDLGVPPRRVVLAGDSAGAGLVLSTLLRVRDAGAELPLAAVCCCPWVDLADSEAPAAHCILQPTVGDGFRDFFKRSPPPPPPSSPSGPAPAAEAWREAHVVERDLSHLPPLLIQTGTFDVFHSHALRLARSAERDAVRGYELDTHAEMPHVFPVFPPWLLPGATAGVTRMAQFVAKHAARSG